MGLEDALSRLFHVYLCTKDGWDVLGVMFCYFARVYTAVDLIMLMEILISLRVVCFLCVIGIVFELSMK